jgi:hypothetical protein
MVLEYSLYEEHVGITHYSQITPFMERKLSVKREKKHAIICQALVELFF